MALDKNTLKASLKACFEKSGNTAESVAIDIANAIDAYVKGAEVTITALMGEISVTGTAAAQSNPVSITLKGGDSTHTGGLS